MNTNNEINKINTVSELIEMLTVLKDGIKPHLSPTRMTTVIVDVYPESVEFVINEAIDYLQSTMDEKQEEN